MNAPTEQQALFGLFSLRTFLILDSPSLRGGLSYVSSDQGRIPEPLMIGDTL